MASSSTIQIIDDDDEFDWEAAVEAIDMACQTTKNPPNSNNKVVHKPPISSSKQSTLDKFIGIRTTKPKPQLDDFQNASVSIRNEVVVEQGDNNGIKIDHEAAKTWIYPVNVPHRDYQFAITKTSLFSNTLVTLPTGLGKTLIAAVVMYNYFRWFPEGKIVFTAPSKPLVMQQIEACHNIVGIPQEWTIDLTGEMSPIKRVSFWEAKRVFFVTPQVLEKDIESGKCLVEHIVCLVIDEAHRATGNYSYCVVVRKLMADNVQLRILALTATPGSKQLAIQKIIDNLQISTLEYRNESDHDVLPYVHDKKIELIKVAMGQDVDDVDSLLSQVIGPICKKLSSLGVLPNRDFQTLSPCDLISSRARFREVPPGNVPQTRYREIEGDIGLLLTLVHIRKLLTGYGIAPAFEMLEDSLKQGNSSLNRLNRNAAFQKLKILMQQSLSNGATSPKLSKMLEVLIDHFKTNDPLNSRVIIFSNFRGSVRVIMDALANIGHIVKATQFIGQSSGKSKGQSQKIQQEVLQKFRAGGYNVIVATSIGEEGLDIMEVDLVLCFDANVSPLRMVQRMGRTGRNHEGRVVVLACEGPELNGYLRKKGSSKTLHKHLRNGGRNSFNFHPSPRMIPHIFKPEVQYVELSIKQFIPRGKKVLDDHTVQLPTFEAKLNDTEIDLLRKYFQPTDNLWRPSLIAFPHFQAFPSRVHNVMHSFRSEMLIDTMQYLQGSSYSRDNRACLDEVEDVSDLSVSIETVEHHDSIMNDTQTFHNPGKENSQREVSEANVSPLSPPKTEEKRCFTRSRGENSSIHCYLFGSDFVSVDVLGRVLVLSPPLHPLKDARSKCTSAITDGLQNCYKQDAARVGDSLAEHGIETKRVNYFSATPTVRECNEMVHTEFSDSDPQQERLVDVEIKVSQTPICSRKFLSREISEALPVVETALILSDDSGNDVGDAELSPRLTNLLKSGVVPESPTNDTGTSECNRKDEVFNQDRDSTSKVQTEPILYSSVVVKNDKVIQDTNAGEVLPSSVKDKIPSSTINGNSVSAINCAVFPVVEEIETPPQNPLRSSCSEDWHFISGDNSESVKKGQKLKRLRKYGDLPKRRPKETDEDENVVDPAELGTSAVSNAHKRGRGEKKMTKDVRVFIEEQAEVSGEIPVSEDDEDEQENNSYDDSFIDDRINPTAGCTSAEDSGRDMMAIYRRSLLSQSPMGRPPISFMDSSPDSLVNRTQINYSGSSEGTNHSVRTPQAGIYSESTGWNSASSRLNPEKNAESSMFYKSSDTQKEDESIVGSRKRKLSSCQVVPLPVQNLESKFLLQSEAQAKDRPHPDWMNKDNPATNEFDDDHFYDGLDLDALEEQATKYLRSKSNLSVQKQMTNPEPQNHAALREEPSFDLGI